MNQLYPNARQLLATAALNLSSVTLAVLLVRSTYSPIFATDANVTDLGGNVVVRSNLVGATVVAGHVFASNVYFGVVSGGICDALIIYNNTGSDATSTLIAYIDTASGLPFLPTGGTFSVAWDAVNGIFTV